MGRGLLEALFEAAWPVGDAPDHHAHVDEVEFVLVLPWLFDVIDFELAVWRDTLNISKPLRRVMNRVWYKVGWMGLKSTPRTWNRSQLPITLSDHQ